jgi:hypothetical protein
MGHINWKGEWVPDESPFDKVSEYSLKQDLIKELLDVAKRYQGRVKDKTIASSFICPLSRLTVCDCGYSGYNYYNI